MKPTPARQGRELLAQQVSARNIATRIAGALGGLSVAYFASRWTMIELTGDGVASTTALARELVIFLGFAAVTLTITSTLPIRRDLIQIRQLVHHNETELRDGSRARRFLRRVQHAFDMAEREHDLFEIAGSRCAGPRTARPNCSVPTRATPICSRWQQPTVIPHPAAPSRRRGAARRCAAASISSRGAASSVAPSRRISGANAQPPTSDGRMSAIWPIRRWSA